MDFKKSETEKSINTENYEILKDKEIIEVFERQEELGSTDFKSFEEIMDS